MIAQPLAAGATQVTVACALPFAIVGALSCPGAAATSWAAELALAAPVPIDVTAETLKT